MQGVIIIPDEFTTVFILSDIEKEKHTLSVQLEFTLRDKISTTNSLYPHKFLDIVGLRKLTDNVIILVTQFPLSLALIK